MGLRIGDVYLALLAEGGGLQASIEAEGTKAASAAGGKVGGTLGQSIARNAQRGLTVAGAAVGTFVVSGVEQFGAFQQRMNEVFTLLPGITDDAMGKMSDDVKAFSRETGKLPDEVIPALYQAISAGVPPDNVFDFLRTANKGAVAGVAKTADEVNLLAAVTKGFGDTSQAATQEAADLSQLMVKLGQTTIPELAASYGQAVPMANALGVSNKELAASSAALFGVTGKTSEVMTQQRAVFTAMITQNPQLTAGLEKMGYATAKQAIESLGLKGALDGLVKTTGGSTQMLQQMLGSSEAVTAALALTGAQSDTFASNLDAMGDSAGTVDDAFKVMDSGVAATGRKLAATAATIAIDVGEKFQAIGPALLALNQGGQLFGVSPAKLIGGAAGGIAGKLAGKLGPALGRGLGQAVARAAPAAIATGVAEAGASSAVAGAATGAGTTIGGLMAAAIPLALVAAAGVGIALAVKAIALDPGLQEQTRGIANTVSEQLATDTLEGLASKKAVLEKGIADLYAVPLGGLLYGDQISALKTQLDVVDAEVERRAGTTTDLVAGALADGAGQVGAAAGTMVDPITGAVTHAATAAGNAAKQLPADVAKGIHDARQAPLDAFDALLEALKHPLTKTAEIARLTGELTSKALMNGLKSGDPEIRAQAEATKQAIISRLDQIKPTAGTISKAAAKAVAAGLKSDDPDIRAAAQHIQDIVTGKLKATTVPAGNAGTAAGQSFVARLRRAVAGGGNFNVNAKVGFMIGGYAAGGLARAGQPAIFGEHGPEIAVPEQDYRVFSHAQSVEMVRSGGGSPITVNVSNPAPEPASTSTRRELRKLALSGSTA